MLKLTTLLLLIFGSATAQQPDEIVFKVGGGITAPKVLYKVDPDYTPETQGAVLIALVVGKDGRAYDIKIARSQGEGPDKGALAAVQRWKFQPGTRYGSSVNVATVIEVSSPKR